MNFEELYKKIRAIDENAEVAPVHTDGTAEEEGIMIGGPLGMPGMLGMGHEEPPKQADNVTMNVSLNGSGAGGVKDLMKILRDIEDGPAADVGHDDDEPLIGDMVAHMAHAQDAEECYPEEAIEEVQDDVGETWGNSVQGDAGQHTHGIDAVTFSGDDMNSKGKSNPHYSPGNNTLRHPMHESLVDQLTAMYEEIKGEPIAEAKGKKPDFLDMDKDGDKKEPMKKAVKDKEKMDESVSQMLALNKRLNG